MDSDSDVESTADERADTSKDHTRRHADVSDLVRVSDLKLLFGGIGVDPLQGARDEDLMHTFGVDQQLYSHIRNICSVNYLLPPGGLEPLMKLKATDLPKDTPLTCVQNPKAALSYIQASAFPTQSMVTVHLSNQSLGDRADPLESRDIILRVILFHPTKRRRDQEYLVLGSQLLTELRDKIQCSKDYFSGQDCSDDPDSFNRQNLAKGPTRPSKSASFFINNTLYDDCRHPSSIAYGKRLIDWIETRGLAETSPRLDHFKLADMASMKFENLELRLGYPYLYWHHGICEHLLIFSDIRMPHASDVQRRADYPLLISQWHGKSRKCNVCTVIAPSWITYDDELAPCCPCYFCEDCFRKLHYTIAGQKVCNFKAYPYHPDVCK